MKYEYQYINAKGQHCNKIMKIADEEIMLLSSALLEYMIKHPRWFYENQVWNHRSPFMNYTAEKIERLYNADNRIKNMQDEILLLKEEIKILKSSIIRK